MGTCFSIASGAVGGTGMLIDQVDGDEKEYHETFLEDHVLGEGEFGVVKMVHLIKSQDASPLACKTLRKGVVFKDNVLYAPLKPDVLKGEINMLRALQGGPTNYCLQVHSIYETPRLIYVVTELCSGGELMEYVSQQETDLRTEDVSRIAFQLLTAISHCHQHHIIHRDIKPENVMFLHPTPKSELRVIDFGSGVMDDPDTPLDEGQEFGRHSTFAGSAFYISPEMFQRTYTQATDVWSVGVTLYVLVAGYPADQLQKAFNILQTSKNRQLKTLPNLPDNLPLSFYDMLEGLLVYRHKRRKTAQEMLSHEFVRFHLDLEQEEKLGTDEGLSFEQVAATAAGAAAGANNATNNNNKSNTNKAQSYALPGSVHRHALMLGYQKFERAVTTLLATMLDGNEFNKLIAKLEEDIAAVQQQQQQESAVDASTTTNTVSSASQLQASTATAASEVEDPEKRGRLDILPVHNLKTIMKQEFKRDDILDLINKLPNAKEYNTFAYQTALLKEFISSADAPGSGGKAKRRSSKNSGDHTNPRVVRRSTLVADNLVHRAGSLRDLSVRSDGDEPKLKGSFRRLISKNNSNTLKNGSNHGPRARRATVTK